MSKSGDSSFPIDWDDWHREWSAWLAAHPNLKPVPKQIPGQNFLADEILGTFRLRRGVVELSEVTFPNLSERDAQTGRLIEGNVRGIGLTWVEPGGSRENTVVHSFAELETALGLR